LQQNKSVCWIGNTVLALNLIYFREPGKLHTSRHSLSLFIGSSFFQYAVIQRISDHMFSVQTTILGWKLFWTEAIANSNQDIMYLLVMFFVFCSNVWSVAGSSYHSIKSLK